MSQRRREQARKIQYSQTPDNRDSIIMNENEFILSNISITFLISMSEAALQQCDTLSFDANCGQWLLNEEKLERVTNACDWSNGPMPLTVVLYALMLSPGAIVTSPLVMNTINCKSSPVDSEGIVVCMSKSQQLWGMVESLARKDVSAFESIFDMNKCSSVLSLKRFYQASPVSLQACISFEAQGLK